MDDSFLKSVNKKFEICTSGVTTSDSYGQNPTGTFLEPVTKRFAATFKNY